ncbi:MAG: histidine phosphatase family protein [Planctomycetaceae bacterium]
METQDGVRQIILVPWGRTEWDAQDRLVGHTDVPLSDEGKLEARHVAAALASFRPAALYAGPDEPARQTAEILAEHLRLKVREKEELHEVNLGHWAGLTEAEFRERFPSVHQMWRDDPTAIQPPEGESLDEAGLRLDAAVAALLKRSRTVQPVILTTGPFAIAAMSLRLTGQPLSLFWQRLDDLQRWIVVPLPAAGRGGGRPPRRAAG